MLEFPLARAALSGALLSPIQAQDPAPEAAPPLPAFARADAEQVAAWRRHIRPDRQDLAFETIPWLTTLADGIRQADAEQKPLLLWVMNGHPLGCT